jgi:hypothetical protein
VTCFGGALHHALAKKAVEHFGENRDDVYEHGMME